MTVKPVFFDIFKSYNLAIQEKCEQSMGSVKSPSDYESLINEARYEWEGKQINGLLPVHALETIENEKEFEEVFQMASLTCDEFIPDSFVKWILASDYMKSIENHAFSNPHIDIKNTSVRILGLSGNLEYSEGLIRLLYSEGEYEELIKETSRSTKGSSSGTSGSGPEFSCALKTAIGISTIVSA